MRQCPIQAECLAQTIISREQHGRVGGVDVKARRREHPELVREVRMQSSTREGRRRRSEDQYAYRQRIAVRQSSDWTRTHAGNGGNEREIQPDGKGDRT